MDYATKGQDVLIVDDEFDSVRPLIRILEKEGCKPHYAANSEEALAAIDRFEPDLIIIDVLLGRDNGFDLFQKFREIDRTREVPILFLSGLGQADATVAGLNLGASDFITKPYNLQEIRARVSLQLRLWDNEKLLKRRNNELSKAYDELRVAQAAAIHAEKLAAIGRLSAGIAHEMSTPLSFIISNLKMLETYVESIETAIQAYQYFTIECADASSSTPVAMRATEVLALQRRLDMGSVLKELRDLSRDCIEGAVVIAKIANDLREFSREEYEDLAPTDMNLIIDKALNLVRNETGNRIEIVREYGEIPLFPCIPGRMIQLLLIVLVNAAQSIVGEGLIAIRTEVRNGRFVLSVSDTGHGIDEDILPHIFEPFYTTKPAQVGTGLGLSIARKIVDFHGGEISIASEVGKGTKFSFVFPLSGKREAATRAND